MRNFFQILSISSLLLISFSLPVTVVAQVDYVPLTPVRQFTNSPCDPSQPTSATNCQINIIDYIPKVFTLAIAVAGGLAVIRIMIGGVKYITADSIGGKDDGRETINSAVLGLLLAIGAYLILYTINKDALSFNLGNLGQTTPAPGQQPPPTPAGTCGLSGACMGNACLSQCPVGSVWPSDFAERLQLTSANITVTGTQTSTPCSVVGTRQQTGGCTSVYRLGQSAISGLLALKQGCPTCSITVTGGTEFWAHSTHGPGHSKVDLSLGDSALNNYIKTTGTPMMGNSCFSGQPAWQIGSAVYVLENNNHWHVCY